MANWYTPGDVNLKDSLQEKHRKRVKRVTEDMKEYQRKWYRENRDATRHYERLNNQVKNEGKE